MTSPRAQPLLALPPRADVASLARAWFVEAAWLREPAPARATRAAVGARFRGVTSSARSEPGILRLTWAAHLEGPLDTETLTELGAPSAVRHQAVYRLRVEEGQPRDDRLLAWLRAAARHAGGFVLLGGATAEPTHPEPVVDQSVYSAVPLTPEAALGLARSVVPAARLTSAPDPEEGIAPYELELPSQFDGSVELRFARAAELPVSLLQLDWREYGPFVYRLVWSPPAEIGVHGDGQFLRIARSRVRPLLARTAVVLAKSAGGVVVDTDGFVLPLEEVVAQAVAF